MERTTALDLALLLAVSGVGAFGRTAEGTCVTAYVKGSINVPFDALQKSRLTATRVFGEIGVSFQLTESTPRTAGSCTAIVLELVTGMPLSFHEGALAYARPFRETGTQIQIFADRVARYAGHDDGVVLGYVIAHEVGHVLEGVNRHSLQGVMKANWDTPEFARMRLRRLKFASEDAALIHAGMAAGRDLGSRVER